MYYSLSVAQEEADRLYREWIKAGLRPILVGYGCGTGDFWFHYNSDLEKAKDIAGDFVLEDSPDGEYVEVGIIDATDLTLSNGKSIVKFWLTTVNVNPPVFSDYMIVFRNADKWVFSAKLIEASENFLVLEIISSILLFPHSPEPDYYPMAWKTRGEDVPLRLMIDQNSCVIDETPGEL
jgi:hypothetical protein